MRNDSAKLGQPLLKQDSCRSVAGNGDDVLGAFVLDGTASAIRSAGVVGQELPPQLLYDLAASVLDGIEPRNGVEALLAGQMVTVHAMGIELGRRGLEARSGELAYRYGLLVERLMKTFTRQAETLARLRGQVTRQEFKVEHVTVESGGQAIVGRVGVGDCARRG